MKNVYTVAQVNGYIKNMFTQDFLLQSILVKGEVSNCKYHSSGHIYFTLKDGKGAIACVMFAGNRSGLKFHMQEGQQVVVGGTIDVFERDGRYQLYAKSITLDGAGQLYERFEQLKRELAEQGLFAPEYKQPIPRFIRTLGVVTAPTGAAVRDIINIATRRNPYVQIILYPAIVQGACNADVVKIEDYEWEMRTVMSNDTEAAQYQDELVVAVGEADELYPDAEIVDMTLTAKDGEITITDTTNGKTYNGTYEVMQKTPKGTDYEIIIDGVNGYATVAPTEYYDGSEIPTLPINIDGYSLYFIPNES